MIRKANKQDYDAIWAIFHAVIQTGDTYVFHPNTPKGDLQKHWFADNMHTYVYEENGQILGTYILKPNQIDLGGHIANPSYMVHPTSQGKGIGKKLCQHSCQVAKELGYIGIQANIVVKTNERAIRLWQWLGFEIIGEIPEAFNHIEKGLVNAYIMYKKFN